MKSIQEAWNNMKIVYQMRYVRFLKESENTSITESARTEAKGHMLECSYVLISIFGLTDSQIRELEMHDYCGLTKEDLEED